ncbi:MAG: hypothetical protein Q7S95_02865 [bacterium]|nr:hypothetical protein [bacterium]
MLEIQREIAMTDMFFVSGNDAARLNGARGDTILLAEVVTDIRRAARDREVACPDESRLPTGTLRQAGFIMMKPDDFYAAARAARTEREAGKRPDIRMAPVRRSAVRTDAMPPRSGKTVRDRENLAAARRAEHRARRNAECQARKG